MISERVKLRFADLEIEFVDRVRGIQQVIEYSERGTWHPVVVYGPEGCGKTAWLKQTVRILRESGFEVIYIDPMFREFIAETNVKDVIDKLIEAVTDVIGVANLKLATLAIDLTKELLKKWKVRRVALLVDDVFQAIGLDKTEVYVKSLLNLIEYPPADYDKIITIVATSEGLSRWRIGRHRWAEIRAMWNMSKEGFKELYELIRKKVSIPTPDFEVIWKISGGNPEVLVRLYEANWDVDKVITNLIKGRGLTLSFISKWRKWLELAVEDPDNLWSPEVPKELVNELVEKNLIVYDLYPRDKYFWIDEPPPKKDLELGIGEYVAWQTPIHRDAVRRVLRS